MPAPYSYDLRSKAIAAVKRGKKKIEVSRFFKISRNTLDLWLKKERETGDYQASRSVRVGTQPKIQDLEKFREFVKENIAILNRLWQNPVHKKLGKIKNLPLSKKLK